MERAACSRRMLAASDYVLVEQCSCGSVHVTIGAITVRLAASAIPELAATLADAARVASTHGGPLSLAADEALS